VQACPSDTIYDDPHNYTTQNMYTCNGCTRVSYGFVHEWTEYTPGTGAVWSRNTRADRSAFGFNGAARFGDITDGSSNTLLMIETPFKKDNVAYGPFLQAYTHTHFITPAARGLNEKYLGRRWPYAWGAGSKHPGGCQAVLGDGSVRFLSENMNRNILWALQSIAQSDIVGEF
jgi:hypothetical protein